MHYSSSFLALVGGVMIGLSVTLMLLFNGRVTGVSGILSGALTSWRDGAWRWIFILGMLAGGFVLRFADPLLLVNSSDRGAVAAAVAGALVGFGTVMAGGCTSGHGVCGVSRFSIRSIVATLTFMFFGFVAVGVMRLLVGGPS